MQETMEKVASVVVEQFNQLPLMLRFALLLSLLPQSIHSIYELGRKAGATLYWASTL